MKNLPFCELKKGSLLIASPDISDGPFFRSVMLLCECNHTGSFAVMINKPIDMEIPDELIDSSQFENPNVSILGGGPVQTNQMMVLHSSDEIKDQTLQVTPGVYLGGDLAFLQQIVAEKDGPYVNMCFGYAGWAAGQLEREYLDGGWILSPSSFEYIFYEQPEELWKVLLKKLGGKYATFSTIPDDLSLN